MKTIRDLNIFNDVMESQLRTAMDVPKGTTAKRWLEIVQMVTTPEEFIEYLFDVFDLIKD